jgi:hypothetical protein
MLLESRVMKFKVGLVAASLYLAAFLSASSYPLFDHRTFSGLFAVLLAWPWVDYLPRWHFEILLAAGLNTAIIFCGFALLEKVMTKGNSI